MIQIKATGDTTLHTAGKYCEEDILVKVPSVEAPTGTLEITENGTHDVTNYASANVNVASSGGGDLDAFIDGSITEVVSNATKVERHTFNSRTNLTTVVLPNATSVGLFSFNNCSSLTTVDLAKVTSIGNSAFSGCSRLTQLTLPKAISIGDDAFSGCSNLTTVDFPLVTSVGGYAFKYCYAITTVDFPLVTSVGSSVFYNCSSLTTVDLASATSIVSYAFSNCSNLKKVVLRSETMCSLGNTNAFNSCYHILGITHPTYNPNGDKDGYIYVPRALVDTYANATNWTTFASQFRALEDYTVDGTITGELDETKI